MMAHETCDQRCNLDAAPELVTRRKLTQVEPRSATTQHAAATCL
ncbi:hypothetical protein D8I24_3976 (plasmid) [Cupriavidus necator H850]|nr:hypothetical protein D8I24_3976 [Cupriavidus necator H850]